MLDPGEMARKRSLLQLCDILTLDLGEQIGGKNKLFLILHKKSMTTDQAGLKGRTREP